MIVTFKTCPSCATHVEFYDCDDFCLNELAYLCPHYEPVDPRDELGEAGA